MLRQKEDTRKEVLPTAMPPVGYLTVLFCLLLPVLHLRCAPQIIGGLFISSAASGLWWAGSVTAAGSLRRSTPLVAEYYRLILCLFLPAQVLLAGMARRQHAMRLAWYLRYPLGMKGWDWTLRTCRSLAGLAVRTGKAYRAIGCAGAGVASGVLAHHCSRQTNGRAWGAWVVCWCAARLLYYPSGCLHFGVCWRRTMAVGLHATGMTEHLSSALDLHSAGATAAG